MTHQMRVCSVATLPDGRRIVGAVCISCGQRNHAEQDETRSPLRPGRLIGVHT